MCIFTGDISKALSQIKYSLKAYVNFNSLKTTLRAYVNSLILFNNNNNNY